MSEAAYERRLRRAFWYVVTTTISHLVTFAALLVVVFRG